MSSSSAVGSSPRYEYPITLNATVDTTARDAANLKRQTENRMGELIGRSTIGGAAAVKLGKDGSYEVLTSQTDDPDRLKSAVEDLFANDKILNGLLEKMKAGYQASSAKSSQTSASTSAEPHPPLSVIDKNGDTVEISEESREKSKAIREQIQRLSNSDDNSGGVLYYYTARGQAPTLSGSVGHAQEAQLSFKNFSGWLLDEAQGVGEYENDFLIGIDDHNNLFVSEVRGASGDTPTDKAKSEKAAIDSILASLNKQVKGAAGQNESEALRTLRAFFNEASQYDEGFGPKTFVKEQFPLLLRTSYKRW